MTEAEFEAIRIRILSEAPEERTRDVEALCAETLRARGMLAEVTQCALLAADALLDLSRALTLFGKPLASEAAAIAERHIRGVLTRLGP